MHIHAYMYIHASMYMHIYNNMHAYVYNIPTHLHVQAYTDRNKAGRSRPLEPNDYGHFHTCTVCWPYVYKSPKLTKNAFASKLSLEKCISCTSRTPPLQQKVYKQSRRVTVTIKRPTTGVLYNKLHKRLDHFFTLRS